MTIAENFRSVLLRESDLSLSDIHGATFDDLARHMHTHLGESRVRALGWWHVVSPFLEVRA